MDYGVIRVARLADAMKLPYIPNWKNVRPISYGKYNIKETDMRVKTASFTSFDHFDLTTGQHIILISSQYHENFAGVILDSEYNESTGLYTYQCQDWSRKWIDKFELAIKNIQLYNVLRYLICRGNISLNSPTKTELENYKNVLKGLLNIGKYDQSLYEGNRYSSNPMKNKVSIMVRDKTYIETIRDLVYSQLGYFDVWFDDRGVLKITPFSKTDWENTGLVLSSDECYGRKFKFSTTNAITGVLVNGTDFTAGTWVMPGSTIGLSLQAFFGSNTISMSNSNKNNTSNAVKSTTKTTTTSKNTKNTGKTMKNPFNNKSKKIIVSADGGSDGFRKAIIKKLKADGWSVKDLGTGAGTHSKSYNILDKSYAVNLTIYNGADPATIAEPVTGWLKGKHEKYGVQLVQMWDTSTWTNPKGMKPYRYGNFNGYHCKKAWDDNYSSGKVDIANLGKWFKKYYPKTIHVCGPTVDQAYKQFKAGGYLKSKGLVK